MKRGRLLMGVLGSSLLLGGAMFTAPRVTHSSGMWYLAGQMKMALGDTTSGLQLMSRAAKERQNEQGVQAPAAKPTAKQVKNCSNSTQAKPLAVSSNAKIENAKAEIPAAAKPSLMMASLNLPENPFEDQDVTKLDAEQLQRATAKYETVIKRWVSEQRGQKYEVAMLQRATDQLKAKGKHPQFIHVVVPDPRPFPAAPAPPQAMQ